MIRIVMGVTGLVLFVVLAGAFVLGSQFATARQDGYAAASISAVMQVSQAAEMHNAMDSVPTDAGTSSEELRDGGYLTKIPEIPAGSEAVRLVGDDGRANGEPATVAVMRLAPDSAAVCAEIVTQSGSSGVETATYRIPAGKGGCFRTDAPLRSLSGKSLYAFQRI